jgi:hypothetical protein
VEFLELFFTQLIAYLEPGSITFLDEEILTDVSFVAKTFSGRKNARSTNLVLPTVF